MRDFDDRTVIVQDSREVTDPFPSPLPGKQERGRRSSLHLRESPSQQFNYYYTVGGD